MDFLQKVDFMMEKYGLNKLSLSQNSGIPYTTIVGWYKKGYEGLKLTTLRKLSDYFNTLLDFWVLDDVTDPNYGKANSFQVDFNEAERIIKYRKLDVYGKEAVDRILEIEHKRILEEESKAAQSALSPDPDEDSIIRFPMPYYRQASSAGFGDWADSEYAEKVMLVKEPPFGAAFIIPVNGNSMEPTYPDGCKVFVRPQHEIREGQVGIFFMDGKLWMKELGNGELISHNDRYPPQPFREDLRCWGLVVGICDDSYLGI